MFDFKESKLSGLYMITPQVFGDSRGYFMETFKKAQFAKNGIDKEFVQDNESSSRKGVLRGLHFQTSHTQGKLVRVTQGRSVRCRGRCSSWFSDLWAMDRRSLKLRKKEHALYSRRLRSWLFSSFRNSIFCIQMH